VVLWALAHRKRRSRAQRRSPIGQNMLRSPGHTLREELDEARVDVMADAAALVALPLLMVASILAQGHLQGGHVMRNLGPVVAVAVLVFVLLTLRRLWKAAQRLDRIKAGYDAELAVGQVLDQLMRQGAYTFHDVPAEGFNIDHVVVHTAGVFAVETKGYTKDKATQGKAAATVVFDGRELRFPTWVTGKPLEQAQRQADWLGKWLSKATGDAISVLPILALPGWYVDRAGRGDVRVYSGKELGGLLKAKGSQALGEDMVRRVVLQLDQRCRTVAPTFAEDEAR
jgi:hypothetical protein